MLALLKITGDWQKFTGEESASGIEPQAERPDKVALFNAALAEADSIATGPSAWSPWKAGLLRKLAHRVAFVTSGGDVAEA